LERPDGPLPIVGVCVVNLAPVFRYQRPGDSGAAAFRVACSIGLQSGQQPLLVAGERISPSGAPLFAPFAGPSDNALELAFKLLQLALPLPT
jgi:hypothetical protein